MLLQYVGWNLGTEKNVYQLIVSTSVLTSIEIKLSLECRSDSGQKLCDFVVSLLRATRLHVVYIVDIQTIRMLLQKDRIDVVCLPFVRCSPNASPCRAYRLELSIAITSPPSFLCFDYGHPAAQLLNTDKLNTFMRSIGVGSKWFSTSVLTSRDCSS